MNSKSLNLGLPLALISLAITSEADAGTATYRFSDLGTLGGVHSSASAINNAGQVVGWAEKASGESHATVWNNATATDLDPLGGTRSVANGINDAGQVVGEIYAAGDFTSHATLWDGTRAIELGTLGGASSSASAINNSGQLAGWAQTRSGESYATVWNGSVATQLEKVDSHGSASNLYEGSSSARGINDNGQIAGISGRGGVLWEGTAVSTALPLTSANAINNSGAVVGMSHYSACIPDLDQCIYSYHVPTLWNDGEWTDLPTLGTDDGEALAINDGGQITGTSGGHAVLWDQTTPIDLNSFLDASIISEGWVLTAATGINEKGWIVGSAVNNQNNITHAFLLTPVPEPETYAMLLAGLGLVCSIANRRKLQS